MLRFAQILAAAAVAVSAVPAAGARWPRLDLRAGVFQRFEMQAGAPETTLRYDPLARRFQVADWQRARGVEPDYAALVHMHANLKISEFAELVFDLDSGELRPGLYRPLVVSVPMTTAPGLSPARVASVRDDPELTSNGIASLAETQSTFLTRELMLRLRTEEDALTVELGRAYTRVMDGLVYDDSALAVTARLGWWGYEFAAWGHLRVSLPTPRLDRLLESPMLDLEFGGRVMMLDIAMLFGWYHDAGGRYDGMWRPWLGELAASGAAGADLASHEGFASALSRDAGSRGNLFFSGVRFGADVDEVLLIRGTFLVQAGELTVGNPASWLAPFGVDLPDPDRERVGLDVFSFAATAEIRVNIREWSSALVAAMTSGAENPLLGSDTLDGARTGWLGVSPHLVQTNLALSGGISEDFHRRPVDRLDLGRAGLLVAGYNLSWAAEGLYVEHSTSVIMGVTDERVRLYGVEIDLEALYRFEKIFSVGLEYDILVPLDDWATDEPVHLLRVGFDVAFSERDIDLD